MQKAEARSMRMARVMARASQMRGGLAAGRCWLFGAAVALVVEWGLRRGVVVLEGFD
jgi:hypothetical protein